MKIPSQIHTLLKLCDLAQKITTSLGFNYFLQNDGLD